MSASHLQIAWQRRRAQINHDWLKNQYLPALDAWVNVVKGHSSATNAAGAFVKDLREWESRREEVQTLIANAEASLSPSCFITQLPLARLRADERNWLGALVHALWKSRSDIDAHIANAEHVLADVEEAYTCVRSSLAGEASASPAIVTAAHNAVIAFADCCHELAHAIEKLPRNVRVT